MRTVFLQKRIYPPGILIIFQIKMAIFERQIFITETELSPVLFRFRLDEF